MKKLSGEDLEKLGTMLRACAASDSNIRETAQKALAADIGPVIRKGIFDESNHEGIFEDNVLAPGATPNYKMDFVKPGDEDNYVAFTLPKQGKIPERHVEGDELWVPQFRIANSIDWDIQYMRNARWDIVSRALEVYQAGFVRKNNTDAWRTLMYAAYDRGMIVSASGSAPFTGNTSIVSPPTEGAFVKELLSRAKTAMMRGAGGNGNAGVLTDVYLSPEAMEDVRAWGTNQVDEFTRREIMVAASKGIAAIYGVQLHQMTEFGEGQEYQLYLTSIGATLPASTREWAVGLDLSTRDSFVHPITQELETFEDPTLYRQQRMGIYGTMGHGWAVLDSRRALLLAY